MLQNPEIFKKSEIFFNFYLSDFIEFILRIRKNYAFLRKKTTKGVDDPK